MKQSLRNNRFVKALQQADNSSELTIRTIVLAIIMTIILTAANAYVGLLVGLTVSASIPAAALSMAILSWFKNSNIRQNNMVQTSASAGEALAAGVIFTVPALVIMQAWHSYHFGFIMLLALSGGILGVIFTIPLRNALVIEHKLPYPEGVATAQILQAGHTKSDLNHDRYTSLGVRHLLQATGVSALFKLMSGGFGMLASSFSATKTFFGGTLLSHVSIQFSPALLGVGYILGLNIAILVFIGGVIGTLAGIPLNWLLRAEIIAQKVELSSLNLNQLSSFELIELANAIWQENRRIGVGAILIGGIWSIVQIAKPVYVSIRTNLVSFRTLHNSQKNLLKADGDLPFAICLWFIPLLLIAPALMMAPLFGSGFWAIGMTLLFSVLLLIFAFVFSSVAGYMAGVVGSSNNPISGVTILTVLISSVILFNLTVDNTAFLQVGPIIVMFLAAVTCSAAAIAGDNMQDLKCGRLVGSTPWKQQIYQLLGVAIAASILPFILNLLDASYGIGRPTGDAQNGYLPAPQAGLMAELAHGIFQQSINWSFIWIGAAIAAVCILLEVLFKRLNINFKLNVLAIAIGIYLPFSLSCTLLIGGLLNYWIQQKTKHKNDKNYQQTGTLLASGLVTGEALMGVVLAMVVAFVMPLASPIKYAEWTGLCAFSLVLFYIYKRTRR
ncbi:OPT family oligopeptide transporter [Catenovulum sediminis]|uniref:Oligopeptide transporter, OPT family n=1 Tax=Catenovulum sediminis TaxID=1740262 RepID=A0ABV1RI76_9ALTE